MFSRWGRKEVLPVIRKTGSYYIQKVEPVESEIVASKKLATLLALPLTLLKVLLRASKYKEKEDLEAIIVLDHVFQEARGYSVIKKRSLED